ncbi:acyl-CoA dehydrogenase family protein [Acidisphaera sp. S103]|uniref:acyl-CoA dehydrogenase family protein n=1 Tax=Acidisphaera sp. S103 TaxID=1747223 RepID=UPI00131D497B|nr:acyl-CoA dehydrogenase family protein [Acidisphaera sp. S103]
MNHVALRPSAIDDANLQALSRAFAADAARVDRDGSFPAVNIGRLRDAGLLALTVPRRYGGLGAGLRETTRVLGAIAEGCASTSLILAMQVFKIAALNRGDLWPEAVRARISAEAVEDGALINALRVEPELGSPTRGGMPATVLRRTGDRWTLSGHKIFCTGAPGLRWMDVWAAHDDTVGHVLVRGDAPGIRIVETWDHIGMRGTCSHDVVFTDVPVDPDHIALKTPAAWLNADPAQMAWNAAGIGSVYTGVARAARDWVVDFLRHRVPTGLGAPLSTLPRAQEKVGEIEMLLSANARLIASIATETDYGTPTGPNESALIKAMVIENAIRAVELAASLAGNHAHAKANAIERHIRDVRSGRVQAPQADASFVTAGRGVLL